MNTYSLPHELRQSLSKPNKALLTLLFIFFSLNAVAQNAYELKKDDFYKTFKKTSLKSNTPVAHLPVALDKMMSEEFFYRGREAAFRPLLDRVNGYLDSLAWTNALSVELPAKGAPWLFVGSSEAETAPGSTMMMRDEDDLYPPMAMHLQKPSKEWKKAFASAMAQQQAEYALVIWVGLTEYPKANKGLFKKKVVLGTDYEHEIRFLSAVDKPVEVLQLTGLLLDREGNVIRAGAEGFLHEDSPFWAQVLNIGTTVDDNALRKLMEEERREDLPGKPLAWRVAAHNLVKKLASRPENY